MIVGASLIAGSVLLGSGAICWMLFRQTRSFGAYEARRGKVELLVMAVHEAQQAIIGQNDQLLAELKRAKSNGHKEVA